jgi:iron(III) transport system substrate-binding protein
MTALPMAKNATAIRWLFKAGLVLLILLAVVEQSDAAGRSLTPSELFFYQGADREQILLEGAKKEGQLVFYNSHTWFKSVAQEFEKKYPFVKVSVWRADGADVMKRVLEESLAGRFLVDVVECTEAIIGGLH